MNKIKVSFTDTDGILLISSFVVDFEQWDITKRIARKAIEMDLLDNFWQAVTKVTNP